MRYNESNCKPKQNKDLKPLATDMTQSYTVDCDLCDTSSTNEFYM